MTNDIAEPRYKYAKSKALESWKTLANSNIPVIINDIVKTLGIEVKESDLKMDGVTRMDTNGIAFILFKKGISDVRKRFTVAHELGHMILEHISFDGSTSQCSTLSQEREANTFAGSLLIPSTDLKKFMKNGDKSLGDIINRYWVSKPAATIAVQTNRLLNKLRVD